MTRDRGAAAPFCVSICLSGRSVSIRITWRNPFLILSFLFVGWYTSKPGAKSLYPCRSRTIPFSLMRQKNSDRVHFMGWPSRKVDDPLLAHRVMRGPCRFSSKRGMLEREQAWGFLRGDPTHCETESTAAGMVFCPERDSSQRVAGARSSMNSRRKQSRTPRKQLGREQTRGSAAWNGPTAETPRRMPGREGVDLLGAREIPRLSHTENGNYQVN